MWAVPCEVPLARCCYGLWPMRSGAKLLTGHDRAAAVRGSRRPPFFLETFLGNLKTTPQTHTPGTYAHQVSTHVSCEQTPGNPGVGRLTLPASRK